MVATKSFLDLVTTLLTLQCGLDPRDSYPESVAPYLEDGMQFDFIVVGAGTAGSAVASRLADNPRWKILLLEAGGYPPTLSEVPSYDISPEINWNYTTEPSKTSCLGYEGGRCQMTVGKVLGGSSTINSMLYVRGLKSDYDTWEEMGNAGWKWDDVLPYFKKSQKAEGRWNEDIGTEGLLTTTYIKSSDKLRDILFAAAKENNVPIHDGESDTGMFESFVTIENGTRCSSAKAFLAKIKKRNLHVATNAHVDKVLIEDGRAVGVEVRIDKRLVKLEALNEVILSAGAFNSPQLLMLSGVGPKKHLDELRIKTHADLQVGQNLQDHFTTRGVLIELHNLNDSSDQCQDIMQYCIHRDGPIAGNGITNVMWFFSTDNQSENPNIQIRHSHYEVDPKSDPINCNYFMSGKCNQEAYATHVLVTGVTLSRPKSRGEVKLASSNPSDKPLIYMNYLTDKKGEDIKALIDALAHIRNLINTPTMKQHGAKLADPKAPNCKSIRFGTSNYWKCNFRNLGGSLYHPVGTCKMGPFWDPKAVVDPRLKVHGISSLRVIDASIMPTIINRDTNAAAVMIGEKGADIIKQDWGFGIDF